jgi:hypothetical protein
MRPVAFLLLSALALALVGSCSSVKDRRKGDSLQSLLTGENRGAEDPTDLIPALVRKHGEAQRDRIEQGFKQVTLLWRLEDGDRQALHAFAERWFVSDPAQREALLDRFEYVLEQVDGYFLDVGREMRRYSELEIGPQMPIDDLFAGLDLSAHASDDFFASKIAFIALLNFPLPTLDEMLAQGKSWSRREWAAVRLARRFALRPSGEAVQARSKAYADAQAYIAGYNLWMHHLLAPGGKRIFPAGVRLISHWNLRDQIKADYAEKDQALGLERQRLIRAAMEHIVDQTIPKAVIDDPRVDWDPAANKVTLSPAVEVETEKMKSQGKRAPEPSASSDREPDTRYGVILEDFHAARRTDQDSPLAPTEIDRKFQFDREIPEKRAEELLQSIVTSPLVPRVAALIRSRLGRPLEPHDIWYSGFLPRNRYTEEELSAITRKRYPTASEYKKDIPRLLQGLGFTKERAEFFDSHIVVDPARGAGHALQSARRGDDPHLRTRVNPDGMDYKGYNIAVHEMGHNVEQICSLYRVDHTLLSGVPATAFTEALAFTFQNRDLELLGLTATGTTRAAAVEVLERARSPVCHSSTSAPGAGLRAPGCVAGRVPRGGRPPRAGGGTSTAPSSASATSCWPSSHMVINEMYAGLHAGPPRGLPDPRALRQLGGLMGKSSSAWRIGTVRRTNGCARRSARPQRDPARPGRGEGAGAGEVASPPPPGRRLSAGLLEGEPVLILNGTSVRAGPARRRTRSSRPVRRP